MSEAARTGGTGADVFISYSRRDGEFVRRLYEALNANGRTCWVDWEGIPPSAKWMDEVRAAIDSSQAFVFVISPDSIASEICREELDHAAETNKRIIPIVSRDVADASAVPEAATVRNWLFFREGDDFQAALATLERTLDTDPDWARVHTRLLVRAVEWDAAGRDPSFALRGRDLTDAERWLTEADQRKDPQPTRLHTEYIVASRQAATRSQRRRTAALGVGFAVASVLAVIAFLQFRRAEDEAQVSRSRELAATSLLQLETNPDLALTLAIEAGKVDDTADAEQAIRQALETNFVRGVLRGEIELTAVAAAPRDGTVATGDAEGTITIWDGGAGDALDQIETGGDDVTALEFSRDGRRLAAAAGGVAGVWDLASGDLVHDLQGHRGRVWWIDVAGDGRLVTAGADGTVRSWTPGGVEDGRVRLDGEAYSAEWSPDGKLVAASGVDRLVRIWDPASGRVETHEIVDEQARGRPEVNVVAFSPDGRAVAAGADDGLARVFRVGSQKRAMEVPAGDSEIYGLSFGEPDRLATASFDGDVQVWNVDGPEAKRVRALRGHQGRVNAVDHLPGGDRLVSVGVDGDARIWEPEPDDAKRYYTGHELGVLGVAFDPAGARIATSSIDGEIRVRDAQTGETELVIPMPQRPSGRARWDVWGLEFGPAGDRIVAGVGDRTARVWSTTDGEELAVMRGHSAFLVDAAFSPRGDLVATASQERAAGARVWDAESGREIASFAGHGDWIFSVSFSPDGRRVVSAGADGTARIWDPETAEELVALEGHRDYVQSAEFSPDGTRVVTASEDRTARIWDAESGTTLQTLRGHNGGVFGASFSPDGEWVATASSDLTARVWDAGSGRLLDILRGHEDWVNEAVFDRAGKSIVTASYDDRSGTFLCELCVPFDELLRLAESRLTRALTPEERAQFLHE